MNGLLIASGLLAGFATLGHVTIGSKLFLRPFLSAELEAVPRKVMQTLFHFITIDFALGTAVLLYAGISRDPVWDTFLAVLVTAIKFGLYALVQIVAVSFSGIEGGLKKMFQWTFFLAISATGLVGVL